MMRLAQDKKTSARLLACTSLALSFFSINSFAKSDQKSIGAEPSYIQSCMRDAAKMYSVHPHLLWAIAKQESGFNVRAVNANKNGSYDMGIMQINSGWLSTLKKFGISEQSLWEPCVNIHVGAWVLSNNIKNMGLTWRAVGAYNAANENKRALYADKIRKNVKEAQNWSKNPNKDEPGDKKYREQKNNSGFSQDDVGVFRSKNIALNIIRTGEEADR